MQPSMTSCVIANQTDNRLVYLNYYSRNMLSEPIALQPRVVTTPIIDIIVHDTFEYRKTDDGGRGMLNWDLHYRRFPRRAEDSLKLEEPIPSPVMVRARRFAHRSIY